MSFVDAFVLYDLAELRGRGPGEIPDLLLRHLAGRRTAMVASDQRTAFAQAWEQRTAGGRILLIADDVDEALAVVSAAVLAPDSMAPGSLARSAHPDLRASA